MTNLIRKHNTNKFLEYYRISMTPEIFEVNEILTTIHRHKGSSEGWFQGAKWVCTGEIKGLYILMISGNQYYSFFRTCWEFSSE